jgi:cob(I)alamin adenosyltransferase
MTKIYTKTGDKGLTILGNGKKVSKASLRVEAYGEIDELNSVIGIALARVQSSSIRQDQDRVQSGLIQIQKDLFEIGSSLSDSQKADQKLNIYLKKRVLEFEKEIDLFSKDLPNLKHFILPGGGISGANLHLARTVCRRVERRIVELNKKEKIQDQILIYLNRLSDLLFTFARYINYKEKKKEIIWFKK